MTDKIVKIVCLDDDDVGIAWKSVHSRFDSSRRGRTFFGKMNREVYFGPSSFLQREDVMGLESGDSDAGSL